MAILDLIKEIPLSAVYKERLTDFEKQFSEFQSENMVLKEQISDLQLQLEQSEEHRRTLENQIVEIQSNPLTFDDKTGTFVSSADGLRYCAKCRSKDILSPLKNGEHEWTCPACESEFKDPSRPYVYSKSDPPDWRVA